uniref:Zinc finger protein 414 n=1 Tax=Nothobranchius pienaari TaxID=704102 RepID=A0A1A8LGS2_9TELE
MMSPVFPALPAPEDENGAPKRVACPLHGCKRAYTEMSVLQNHIKDHEIAAQSLPGKVLLCSSAGCGRSFPNMQKLMEHMRHHHKPNIYFQCESCRTKLRSYRGLLAHLHTCSKVPRSKSKATEPTPPLSAAAGPNLTTNAAEQQPPHLESVCSTQQVSDPQESLSAAPLLDSADPPVLGPPILPLQEPVPLPSGPSPTPSQDSDTPEAQSRTTGPFPPVLHSPPGSSAVWKKNQGTSCNRRVLWEHTRGRYTCVQCGHKVTNRKEMTQHINSHHSGTKVARDPGNS